VVSGGGSADVARAGGRRRQGRRIALLPGDGIGPEITRATVRVLEATGLAFDWEPLEAGLAANETHGDPLPQVTLDAIARCGIALKGPLETPVGTGYRSANVAIRKRLDLFANVRPILSRPLAGIPPRFDNVDLVVVRENTEGIYSGLEHMVVPGVAESLKIVTEAASRRIGRFAFQLARDQGRKRVTAVHKANIMKLSDGLFLDCVRAEATEFPDIEYEEAIVDAMCMRLVLNPERYDVLVMGNLYGDIISDLAAGLIGGLGLAPSANIGAECAVFEAVHGTAPDIAGKDIANPTALILSGVMMLRHLGHRAEAAALDRAVSRAISGAVRTGDMGGTASTQEFADAIIGQLGAIRAEAGTTDATASQDA